MGLKAELERHSVKDIKVYKLASWQTGFYYFTGMLDEKKLFIKLCVSKYNTVTTEAKMIRYDSRPFFPQVVAYSLEKYPYVITEFIDMIPLAKKILTEEEKHQIVLQAVIILEWMKEKGIIHRDIRPENVMLAPGNRLVLFDFGWAIFREDGFKKTEYKFIEKIVNVKYRENNQRFDDAFSLYQVLREIWGEESELILVDIKKRIGKFFVE